MEKLKKIREENPNFDKELVDNFAKLMPELLSIIMDGYMYDEHIGSKDVAIMAKDFITDDKGKRIGFPLDYEKVLDMARSYVDLNDTDFYPTDLWVWSNVKYGDVGHVLSEPQSIVKLAISDLTDADFPFYAPSKKAFYWLKKHIEKI